MKMTEKLNDALTVMSRSTELEMALRSLKSALQEVSSKSYDNELTTEIYEMREFVEKQIRKYSYRATIKYIENEILTENLNNKLRNELKSLGFGYNGRENLLTEMVEKYVDENDNNMKALAEDIAYFMNNEYEEYADSLDEEEKRYEDYYLYYSSFYKL